LSMAWGGQIRKMAPNLPPKRVHPQAFPESIGFNGFFKGIALTKP